MSRSRISSDEFLLQLLESCKTIRDLKQLHTQIIKWETCPSHTLLTAVSRAISSCGACPDEYFSYAKRIVLHNNNRSVFAYNSILRGFSLSENPLSALTLYREMLHVGSPSNNYTYLFLLKACIRTSEHQCGFSVHDHIVKRGHDSDSHIRSSLIDFYINSGDLLASKRLFEFFNEADIVFCNTMLHGYVKFGELEHARLLFNRMMFGDEISWNIMIKGYGMVGKLEEARALFNKMPCRNIISWNSLLQGYASYGSAEDALKLFDNMPNRDVVSWNTMLACYFHNGKPNEVLNLFDEMLAAGTVPTAQSVVSLLSACAHIGSLDKGLRAHARIIEHKIEVNHIVSTALVDMYCRCGSIYRAIEDFNSMKFKDVLAWNIILSGMAAHGYAKEAEELFGRMEAEGVTPNDMTFVALLAAFSHAGMVEKGTKLLESMGRMYNVIPKVEHYGCVLDLLARAGHLEEAMSLIRSMPVEPSANAWGALLGGCRIHNNMEVGERVGKHLVRIQPHHSGRYILLSNIYAAAKLWDNAVKVLSIWLPLSLPSLERASTMGIMVELGSPPANKSLIKCRWVCEKREKTLTYNEAGCHGILASRSCWLLKVLASILWHNSTIHL